LFPLSGNNYDRKGAGLQRQNGATLPDGALASATGMRPVRIRDTLSGELVELDPKREAGIYACGPTVYSRIHIGNARPFVVFSLFARFLRAEGYRAKLVVNVTDVNDKIYAAARDAGEGSAAFAERMTRAYLEDTGRLGLGRPDAEPLATETIEAIVALISDLVESGHAYESGGDVYYRVRSFAAYGKLSNRRTEDMDQGEEAGSASLKEDPLDFALWKGRKPGEDTSWDSPWGPGRPGWHIECSAMAEAELGPSFAIHGGGSDLVFPHHENEIAQTEAARGRPLARIWMHNGMVRLEGEKMAKSVGNIFLLHEALQRAGRDALVMYFVSGHYRQPIAYSEDALAEAAASVERIRDFARRLDPDAPAGGIEPYAGRFFAALADDFNTPAARAALFDWIAEGNRRLDAGERLGTGTLREMLWVLGLDNLLDAEEAAPPDAERLLEEREAARAARDFAIADAKRDELAALGWEVRDTPAGPKLVRSG